MLGILLLILKIIGWVLLGLICLLLALFLLVLLVPVPYRLQAEFGEGFHYRLRVFGIQVFPGKEKAGRKKRRRKAGKSGTQQEAADEQEASAETVQKDSASEEKASDPETANPQAAAKKAVNPETADKNIRDKKTADESGAYQPGNEKPGAEDTDEPSMRAADEPAEAASQNGPKELQRPKKRSRGERKAKKGRPKRDKAKRGGRGMNFDDLRKKWALLRGELTDEGNRRALLHGFSELAYLLRHCGPRRVKADVAFSLADPANTGYASAALSLCPFVYSRGCSIIPDFESEKLYAKGRVDVKGHVRLMHFGISGVRLLIDRDVRAILKKVRR